MNTVYIPTSHKRHNSIKAFTLIELMVVVGIITILGVIVGPGLKKTYDDFLMKKTLADAATLVSACRTYYLIYNEYPTDSKSGYIVEDLAPFVPSNLFNKTKTSQYASGEYHDSYALTMNPFNDPTLKWDINNWIIWSGNTTMSAMYVSIQADWDSEENNIYLNAFKKQYPLSIPQPLLFGGDICIPFPEFPLKANLDSISKNRYY